MHTFALLALVSFTSPITKITMGLDMYASRRLHVKQWEHQRPNERYKVRIEYAGKPVKGIRESCISDVEEEVMYWRKANHIHAWFVDNVQDGQDDCKPYYVDWDDLDQLRAVCQNVITTTRLVRGPVLVNKVWNSKHQTWDEHREPGWVIENPTFAETHLPRREGCFFGHYDYDERYLDDVFKTRDWVDRMMTDRQSGVPGEIYYYSSW